MVANSKDQRGEMMGLNEQGVAIEKRASERGSLLRENTTSYEYREIPSSAELGRVDVLEQLKANIRQIEDLNGRLGFLLKEVRSVLKKA